LPTKIINLDKYYKQIDEKIIPVFISKFKEKRKQDPDIGDTFVDQINNKISEKKSKTKDENAIKILEYLEEKIDKAYGDTILSLAFDEVFN
jgi:hypothetical protein